VLYVQSLGGLSECGSGIVYLVYHCGGLYGIALSDQIIENYIITFKL
jgi:hypothetical protein